MKGAFRSVDEMREATFKAKAARRLKMAKRPFHEKVAVIRQLQAIAMAANPKFAARWKGVLPWKI